jgi:outer membrane protein
VKGTWIVFVLLLWLQPAWGQERVKIGFIDLQRAIMESHAGRSAKERFQTEVKKVETELLKEKQEVERLKSEIEKKGMLLKAEERSNMDKELQRRVVNYQRRVNDSQQELRQREGEMTSEILRDLEKVVTEVGKNEKFTLILERSQVLYSDQGVDITPKVVEMYNSRASGKVTKTK